FQPRPGQGPPPAEPGAGAALRPAPRARRNGRHASPGAARRAPKAGGDGLRLPLSGGPPGPPQPFRLTEQRSVFEAIREGDIPGAQLRRRQRLPVAREEAWRWLVEPAKLVRWLADEAEVEPGPTGGLLLSGASPRVDPPPAPWRERGKTVE